MAETRDWLRGLGIISDADWTYYETRSLRDGARRASDADDAHDDAIRDLGMQVRRLQVTVGVLMQTLIEAKAVDQGKLLPRLESALKNAGIRGDAGRDPRAPAVEPAGPPKPMLCADCGAEVKVANSFLRDGARVCQDCY